MIRDTSNIVYVHPDRRFSAEEIYFLECRVWQLKIELEREWIGLGKFPNGITRIILN